MRTFFIFLCLLSAVELKAHQHRLFRTPTVYEDVIKQIITDSSKTYICSTNTSCEKIKNFEVEEPTDCYDKYLKIKFNVTLYNRTQVPSFGYLSQDNEILENQVRTSICHKIKRFLINDKKVIISIDDYVYLVDQKKANDFIKWELLCMLDLWTWLRVLLDVYDEKNNSTFLYKAFKEFLFDTVVLYSITVHITRLIKKYYRFALLLSSVMEEHDKKKKK